MYNLTSHLLNIQVMWTMFQLWKIHCKTVYVVTIYSSYKKDPT